MISIMDLSDLRSLTAGNGRIVDLDLATRNKYKSFFMAKADTVLVGAGSITPDYATTGTSQVVNIAVGDIVHYGIASGSTGTGVLYHYYKAKAVLASTDLNLDLFDTDVADWEDLGFSIGGEVSLILAANEEVALAGSAITRIKGAIDNTVVFTKK